MRTVSVFDCRKGLSQSYTIENSPADASPELKNCWFLPKGFLTKRRGIAQVYTASSKFTNLETLLFAKMLQRSEQRNMLYNWHFSDYDVTLPDGWIKSGTVAVIQSGAEHTVSMANSSGSYAGIIQQIGTVRVDGASAYGGRNTIKLDYEVRANITNSKNLRVMLQTNSGDVVSADHAGTGAWATYTGTLEAEGVQFQSGLSSGDNTDFHLLVEDGGTALIDYATLKGPSRSIFCFYLDSSSVGHVRMIDDVGSNDSTIDGDLGGTVHGGAVAHSGVYDMLYVMLRRTRYPSGTYPRQDASSLVGLSPEGTLYYRSQPGTSGISMTPPLSWKMAESSDYRYSDLPQFVTTHHIGQGTRMIWAKNDRYPSKIWFSRINNFWEWEDYQHPYSLSPGYFDVGNGDEEITGLEVFRESIVVFKKEKAYILKQDDTGLVVVDVLEVGIDFNTSIVKTDSNIFGFSREGIFRIIQTANGFDYELMTAPIDQLIDELDFSYRITGTYNKRRKIISWICYSTKESKYVSIDFYLKYGSFGYNTYPSDTKLDGIIGQDYIRDREYSYLYRNPAGNSSETFVKSLWDTTKVDDDGSQAIDFSYKTPILHMGNLESMKKWHEFILYYNGLSSNGLTYAFTIKIDRNPLENDLTISSADRYIRITSKIEVGDGSTWSDMDAVTKINLGDISGTAIDFQQDLARKRFKFTNIGECKAIQIEFSDNSAGNDFVLFGYTLNYKERK